MRSGASAPLSDGGDGRRPSDRGVTRPVLSALVALALLPPLVLLGRAASSTGPDRDSPEPSTTPRSARQDRDQPVQVWTPSPGTAWQWQLQGRVKPEPDVPVYDVDGFDTPADTVAELKRHGGRAVCYLSVGAWEDWRPDADQFPPDVLGSSNGWSGERWLDIRRIDVLGPVLRQRIAMCADKGFDAVEPDNVDGYANRTGFSLTYEDQLAFNRWIADAVHQRGMSVALKNNLDQVPDLVDVYDFAVNEQCFEYDECDALLPFTEQGKAVLHVEYRVPPERFCGRVPRGFSSMQKREDLGAWRRPC